MHATVTYGAGDVRLENVPDSIVKPGENHWHGAAPTRFMTHLAMQQADAQGNAVTWGEHVTDAEYAEAPSLEEGGR